MIDFKKIWNDKIKLVLFVGLLSILCVKIPYDFLFPVNTASDIEERTNAVEKALEDYKRKFGDGETSVDESEKWLSSMGLTKADVSQCENMVDAVERTKCILKVSEEKRHFH